jgi:phage tail-like protein
MRQPIRLTMKKGVVSGQGFLSAWFQETYANPFKTSQKDILIDLCDEAGKAIVRWKVQGALPVKLDAPTFDANSNEAAIEIMEFIARDIQVDYSPT